MSDFCMFEVEDISWDKLGESGDHVVPHPGDHGKESAVQCDSRKKPQHELLTGLTVDAGNEYSANVVSKGNAETYFSTLKNSKHTISENCSWSDTSDGILAASCDINSAKEVISLESNDARMAGHSFKSNSDSINGEFCANDPILDDRCAGVENNLYSFPLSQAENDLGFFDNDHKVKGSSDLLYYGWPDIGNFEDVDRIFRSCDSTSWLGNASNEQELCWFPPSHAIEVSDDATKSGFEFSSLESTTLKSSSEHHEAHQLNSPSASMCDFNKKNISINGQRSSHILDSNKLSSLGPSSYPNGFVTNSEIKGEEQVLQINDGVEEKVKPYRQNKNINSEMINLHKKRAKHQNQAGAKRKDQYSENGVPFNHAGNLRQLADAKVHFNGFSFPAGTRKLKQKLGPDSSSYSHSQMPCIQSDTTSLSCIDSESIGHPSFSLKESSYASNQLYSMESPCETSFETHAKPKNEKEEKLLVGFSDHSNNPVERHRSNVHESSCMSSELDEISPEEASFRQLRQVTEQLDIRTRICIRDGLYRLAKGVLCRTPCENTNIGGSVGDASGDLMAEEPNKSTGYMGVETMTNPIDRTIANLLFFSLEAPSTIHGSVSSPPGKLVSHEEHSGIAAKLLLMNDDN